MQKIRDNPLFYNALIKISSPVKYLEPIFLSVKDDTPIEITLENGKAKLYSAPVTTKIGSRVEHDKRLISKVEDILLIYFRCLEIIRECNPNEDLFYGNNAGEHMKMIAESERINSELEKQYQEEGKNL